MNLSALFQTLASARVELVLQDGALTVNAPKGALTPAVLAQIKLHKDALIAHLGAARQTLEPIAPADRSQPLQMSFAQQRLWLLDQIDGGGAHYNLGGALKLEGQLDVAALQGALDAIVERHESLRSCFVADAHGQARQVVQPGRAVALAWSDLSALPEPERGQALARARAQELARPFDLSADLMLRAQLIRLDSAVHVALVTMHHIAADGWSLDILIREIGELYAAIVAGRAPSLPPLAIQYADYAQWQRRHLQGAPLARHMAYWTDQLRALPAVHGLPLDMPRPAVQTFAGGLHLGQIDAASAAGLRALCQEAGATLFMGVHAAFSVLLARYSKETDIVVGTPVANRERAEAAPLIGFFVNNLVLRSDVSGTPSFVELLAQSRRLLLDAYEHQHVPFEQIVEQLQPERSLGHSPLFQIMLTMQNDAQAALALPGLRVEVLAEAASAKYDLTVSVAESAGGLSLRWEYNRALFLEASIARMAGNFGALLAALVRAPRAPALEHAMLSDSERRQVLFEWNDTGTAYPADRCIHELFEGHVARDPHACAIAFGDQRMTYAQLDAQANRLAHYLVRQRRVGPDTLVGLCMERSPDMLVCMLGILKAGGAYLPLDPHFPAARLAYMCADASLATVLTTSGLGERLPGAQCALVCIDSAAMQLSLAAQPDTALPVAERRLAPGHLAHVLYTSGSTGTPKGTEISHRNVIRLVCATHYVDYTQARRIPQFSTIAFDASTMEIWGALLNGGCVVLPAPGRLSLAQMSQTIVEQGVDTLLLTTAVFNEMVDFHLPALLGTRQLLTGGEALSPAHVRRFLDAAASTSLICAYGPTESTTIASTALLTPELVRRCIPIGKPIANTTLYILDSSENPVPVGVPGELHIGGAGVARGYLGRSGLTAEKFIPDPFGALPGARLYKSGDLARFRADGNIEFLGRMDSQVKIRGQRIELGEIEAALCALAGVREALVLARADAPGDKRLVAYLCMEEDGAQDADALQQALRRSLPEFMVPAHFLTLERFPTTPNGKVDRNALPAPALDALQAAYVAPATPVAQVLCALWQEVLGIDRVGISDNFFRLGGHSLSATRLVARINQVFKVALPLKTVFRAQTVDELAQELVQLSLGAVQPPLLPVARDTVLLASFAQQRLWLLDQIDGGGSHYNIPVALSLKGDLDRDALARAFSTILARHEVLRTCLRSVDGVLEQVVQPPRALELDICDLSALAPADQDAAIAALRREEGARGFDLQRDLMLRARLLCLGEGEHVVLATMHHIAADGWSLALVIEELSVLYAAYVQGRDDPLAPLPIQYADYAHWQRGWLRDALLARQLDFWRGQLHALPVVHSLALDFPRPALQTFAGKVHASRIDLSASAALRAHCREAGATLFMGLHAAFAALLSRYSNETDIVVGTPIANREQAELANLIGFFVNNLVLRSDLSGRPSFKTLLEQSKGLLLDAYAHQQVPFEQIVEHLQPERSLSHSPLFQVMLALQNNAEAHLSMPGVRVRVMEEAAGVAKYDLTLNVCEDERGLALAWEYNTDLFRDATIARMAGHFARFLDAMLAAPDAPLATLPLLAEEEIDEQLNRWNSSAHAFPLEHSYAALFAARLAAHPDRTVAVCGDERLSYRELDERAGRIARALLNAGAGPDTVVPLLAERGLTLLTMMVAVLKAGAALLPLEANHPPARLRAIVANSRAGLMLASRACAALSDRILSGLDGAPTVLLAEALDLDGPPACLPVLGAPSDLAYVISTSGSTGTPKAAMVEQRGMLNNIFGKVPSMGLHADDRIAQTASAAFDISIWQFLAAPLVGATVHILPDHIAHHPRALLEAVESAAITVLEIVPSMMRAVLDLAPQQASLRSLRWVMPTGEALSLKLVQDWFARFPDLPLMNVYGPAECADDVACHPVLACPPPDTSIPIGRPTANNRLYILDAHLQPLPIGVCGEICVAGVGVGRGYLHDPVRTEAAFPAHPFAPGERFYRTGDMGRYRADGVIEFLGRRDHQVKIRGLRIELGDIEAALADCPEVRDATVLAHTDAAGEQRLLGYLVAREDAHLDVEAVRARLHAALPSYMVPTHLMVLARLPLTPNGKIDRKALPAPDSECGAHDYIAPRTQTQILLARIWAAVLKRERVGILDNFFQLGGHSLMAMQVIADLQQAGRSMAVRQLFATPTLQDLAAALDAATPDAPFVVPPNAIPPGCTDIAPHMLPLIALAPADIAAVVARLPGGAANVQDIYPLAALQEGILFHHMMSEGSDPYVLPVLFRLDDEAALQSFLSALQAVIDRHDVLRTAILWANLPRPVQVVCRRVSLPVSAIALDPARPALDQMLALCVPGEQWIDLGQAPLLRVEVAADPHSTARYLLLRYHHIISDHVGMEIIQNEVLAIRSGQAHSLPPARPYRDFVATSLHQAGRHDAQRHFTQMLGDVDWPTLPFDLSDVQGDGSRAVEVRQEVPHALGLRLRACARRLQSSPAAVFHAAWAIVIANCSNRDDVVFGTVLSGRLQGTHGAQDMLGMFINTLPVRVKLDGMDAAALVRQVHGALQDLLPYEQASLAQAQRCSGVGATVPLFSAMLNYRHSAVAANAASSAALAAAGIACMAGRERTNYPFILSVDEYGDAFALDAQIDRAVDAHRLVGYVQTVLVGLVDALDRASGAAVMRMGMLSDFERSQQLLEWNATQTDFPGERCIHALFEEHALSTPDAPALVYGDAVLTYAGLNARANRLAHLLRARHACAPDTLIGICLERSMDFVVAVLAVLKAGAAYVPLDPDYPDSRLKFMIDDARLATVLATAGAHRPDVIDAERAIYLDDPALLAQLDAQPASNIVLPDVGVEARRLAYVMYTSGSTGNPKGVMVQHDSIVRLVRANAYIELGPENKVAQASNLSFDAATFEIWGALANGAALVHVPTDILIDAVQLESHLGRYGIDTLFVTTALFNAIANDRPSALAGLRHVLFGGENASLAAIGKIAAHGMPQRLLHVYGPTENTTFSTFMELERDAIGQMTLAPIGRPLSNGSAYVVNASGNIVPVGVAGELLLGGAGLARGYLNRPGLTAEKFVPNPFARTGTGDPGARLFRTGDQVRWLPDGTLEFLGRIDQQVKMHGFRIELGEIENVLSTHPAVKAAVVIAAATPAGDLRLAAYVVAAGEDASVPPLAERLRDHLSAALPRYMVPGAFVLLEQMPLTPNGKVNRRALPAPEWGRGDADYLAPRTEVERKLAAIWGEVLRVGQVGVHDNFFELGGHSLLATQLGVRIAEQFGRTLSLRLLFEASSLAAMAGAIESELRQASQPAPRTIARLARESHRVRRRDGELLVDNATQDNG